MYIYIYFVYCFSCRYLVATGSATTGSYRFPPPKKKSHIRCIRNSEKGALEKGYLHKIVRNWLSNSRQIWNNFAHPSSDVRNEIPAILRKFGAQFDLRNAPFANAPFSGFLIVYQRRRNDNINKICILEGVGEGENLRKIVQNAVFPGTFHDNKIWKFCEFYVRNFVVIWEAPSINPDEVSQPPPWKRQCVRLFQICGQHSRQRLVALWRKPPVTSLVWCRRLAGGLPGFRSPLLAQTKQDTVSTTGRPCSGKEKQHKHKLFGPDFPRTFLTLTPGCPGVEKFLPTTGAAGKRSFWCGRPWFAARTSMTRRVAEKLCTKKVCVDVLAPTCVRTVQGAKGGYGMVVDGIVKLQTLKFTFQGLNFPEKIPCFAG